MPYSINRLFFIQLLLALALLLQSQAQAATVAPVDARNVRGVVQGQLDAFAADDARKAYGFAAPSIRQMFGTPEHFLAMVRAQYPVVHRPASLAFQKPEADGGNVIQRVEMTDAAGAAWMATYLMQRQKDGRWRINGCVVLPVQSRLST